MDEAFEAFASALPESARPAFTGLRDATLAKLTEHFEAGRSKWSDFATSLTDFALELARRLSTTPTALTPAELDSCHGSDVYLAIACGRGIDAAIRALEATILVGSVNTAVNHTRATPDQGAEVTAILRRQLFVDEPGRTAACRSFSGRSALTRFVTVIATRELIRIVSRSRKEEPLEDDMLVASLAPGADPELSVMRRRYHGDVDESFRAALGQLTDRSRSVLRYQLVRKWSVAEIAEVYKRAPSTVNRWLAEAREELGEKVRHELAGRLAIDKSEVDSIVRLVQSRIELSLDRL
jgi:RNA polymerase sigma-70 factor (ECF subfamily)